MPRDTWVKRVATIGGIPLHVDERMPANTVALARGNQILAVMTNLSTSEDAPMDERYAGTGMATAKASQQYRGAEGVGMQAPPQPRRPLLDEALESIEGATKELADLTGQVAEFTHRTLGPIPEVRNLGTAGRDEPASSYRASIVRDRLETLHGQIRELRVYVHRLADV